jgi:hypothetical protein
MPVAIIQIMALVPENPAERKTENSELQVLERTN